MGDALIIAIDFGNAYSGHAFNITRSDEESNPYIKRWGRTEGLDTPKTPTCILFDQDENFLKFGYEAITAYLQMRGEESRKHYFFGEFKLALYGKELNNNLKIKAANGKELTALKVFSESLRFLKDDALKTLKSAAKGDFSPSDFTWVLTVPAIWDLSAKQFMREAAIQAEIVTEETENKLVIALEAEAASVWCKKLPSDGFIKQSNSRESLEQSPGTQYIVVDCGGGTIDITVHRILKGGALKELHKASGNDLGGQTVDKNFKHFLKEIFADGVWDKYEESYPSEVQRMLYDFTRLKQVDEDVRFSCPFNLGKLAKKKKNIEKFFESVEGASWDEGFIKISRQKLRSFFAESLQSITQSLREILKKDLSIEYILLVGGFAQSQILRQHIDKQFSGKCEILCPFRPQEAVLRGAVEFGRNINLVASRKSVFTYGVAVLKRFEEHKHKQEKRHIIDEDVWCKDVFQKLVEEGEDLGLDETREHVLDEADLNQTDLSVRFFRSLRKDPEYVDDVGVQEVGSFKVELRDPKRTREHKVKLELKFGSTEITATGTDLSTGEKYALKLNLMTS